MRRYRRADLHAIFTLDTVCFEPPFRFTLAAMRQFAQAQNALTVIAERAGRGGAEIVGFCIAHLQRNRVGYVVTLDVAPEERRRGLALRMMQRIEEQAREAGCDAMALHVSVENAGAIRFYERSGYARSHREQDFYGAGFDAFVYRKPLTTASG